MVFQAKNKDNFIIIDGSSYLYRAFFALPNLKTSTGLHSGAIHGFANMLNRIIGEYDPKYLLMVFDAKGKNFRHSIYDSYKANRNAMPSELSEQTRPIIDLVKAYGLKVIQEDGVEADDVIASAVKQVKLDETQTIISSGDKDLSSYLFIIFSRESISGGLIKNSFTLTFIGKSSFSATSFFASSTVSDEASKFSFNFPFSS